MKLKPMTAAKKLEIRRAGVLDAFVASNPGPFNPESLSRSYGVDLSEVTRILKMRGKQHG